MIVLTILWLPVQLLGGLRHQAGQGERQQHPHRRQVPRLRDHLSGAVPLAAAAGPSGVSLLLGENTPFTRSVEILNVKQRGRAAT